MSQLVTFDFSSRKHLNVKRERWWTRNEEIRTKRGNASTIYCALHQRHKVIEKTIWLIFDSLTSEHFVRFTRPGNTRMTIRWFPYASTIIFIQEQPGDWCWLVTRSNNKPITKVLVRFCEQEQEKKKRCDAELETPTTLPWSAVLDSFDPHSGHVNPFIKLVQQSAALVTDFVIKFMLLAAYTFLDTWNYTMVNSWMSTKQLLKTNFGFFFE